MRELSQPRHLAAPPGQAGFTAIELMVTVAVLGLLAALAAPDLRSVVSLVQLRSASYDLVADLTLARSEALKRGTTVQVLPKTGGWVEGWTVEATGVDDALIDHKRLGGGVAVVGTEPAAVTFDLYGRLPAADGVVRIGLSDGQSNHRCITLAPSGRPKAFPQECPE